MFPAPLAAAPSAGSTDLLSDPCRLVRQVKEFGGCRSLGTASPAGQAGRGRGEGGGALGLARSSYRTASPAGQAGRGRKKRSLVHALARIHFLPQPSQGPRV